MLWDLSPTGTAGLHQDSEASGWETSGQLQPSLYSRQRSGLAPQTLLHSSKPAPSQAHLQSQGDPMRESKQDRDPVDMHLSLPTALHSPNHLKPFPN